ncbi:hypothetical protein EZL74_04135 [Flavobacterium silvisoli]|uniref:Lipocalin-like domain-containing protein n=1 Tax=Flavobacterium silvisoli TaxID=2529433 RepID=A0A4Q9Z2G7_9FLAO|nr:hypothetical protein [Flavobacterium silvisoli]TBX70372.1 hypothetical protein EZL74_04135 [Flavobacterium silvisoli]
MKRLFIYPALAMVFFMNTASMCSSDSSASSTDPTPVINTAKQGTWRVTSYIDSGTDETNHFTGYNFTFDNNNVLTASNGTNTYTGTWLVTTDDSNDDSPSNDLDFNIAFASPADFLELTDDWHITTYTATTISLTDVSGGNGGTDVLVFTKN